MSEGKPVNVSFYNPVSTNQIQLITPCLKTSLPKNMEQPGKEMKPQA